MAEETSWPDLHGLACMASFRIRLSVQLGAAIKDHFAWLKCHGVSMRLIALRYIQLFTDDVLCCVLSTALLL